MCLYMYPPIVVRQLLGKNVTAATNTHSTIQELLDASGSMRSVSFQMKVGDSYFQNCLFFLQYIVQCYGSLTTSDHQLYNVTPLKKPFGLLIRLLQSQSHVTPITHSYSLRCVTFTQLTIIHVRNYSHLSHSYTFTLADFSAINYFHRLYIFTLRNSRRDLTPRIHLLRLLLKTAT
jgi:hypothetical protein